MTPPKQYINAFRNDEASYGEASVEFAKAYVHLQCALTSAEAFYDIMHRHHVDMGEVKQDYNRCFNYMDRLAKTISKHLGVDTKALLGKVYDEAQADIDHELYGNDNDDDENEKNS